MAAARRCAEFSRRFPYVLKCDLRLYSPSSDYEILLHCIDKTIADRQVMALIRRILESQEDGHRKGELSDCRIPAAGNVLHLLVARNANEGRLRSAAQIDRLSAFSCSFSKYSSGIGVGSG